MQNSTQSSHQLGMRFFCGENWLSWVLAAPSCGVAVDAAFSPSGWLAWSCRGITVSSLENLERKRGEFRGPLMSLSMGNKDKYQALSRQIPPQDIHITGTCSEILGLPCLNIVRLPCLSRHLPSTWVMTCHDYLVKILVSTGFFIGNIKLYPTKWI